ncbi:Ig-like domain repeat protein [Curtobacterium sp. ZW137]|uniref:Ig-like domain repeat protein n=1 Tax=Curtobacterium sp. ZW137 TaxID=2485104 RepID=UPI000F92BB80|nr:Ig-like domain repeat protein [Curtobacterium sp. ZW137]ROP65043.1 Ig-like domain-containing protein [Curtobacterium sp. ZW137]
MFASASARHRARPKVARRLAVLGAALVLGGVSVGVTTSAANAIDVTNVSPYAAETFTNATVSGVQAPAVPANGTTAMTNSACLTAAAGTGTASGATIPGCSTSAINAAGSGALRLTDAVGEKEGGVGATTAIPTGQGLDVTFNSYQYGGDRADGIVFYLATTDPYDPKVPTTIGAKGGSLGYSASYYSDATNGTPGLANGYLGFGLDAYGNFRSSTYQGKACAASTAAPSVSVRGPGYGVNGYCLLTPDTNTTGTLTNASISGGKSGSRASSAVPVEVVVNTSDAAVTSSGFSGSLTQQTVAAKHWAIIVKPLGQSATKIVSGVLPSLKTTTAAGVSSDWYDPTTGLPYKLTYGWVASTGGVTDIHEVNQFTATSANGRTPVLAGTADVSDATPQQGAAGTYTVHPTVTSTGGAELGKVRISTTFGAGATPKSGTFTAGSYSCTTTGQDAVCTTPAALAVDAGKALPDLAVPYTGTAAIGATVKATSTVASTDALKSVPVSASLTVAKVPTTTKATLASAQVTAGDSTTVTGTVVDADGRVLTGATGTVTFTEGSTVVCSGVTVSKGIATCAYTPTTKGTHTITATYSGDPTYTGSTATQTITASARSTAFSVQAAPAQVQYGTPSTVTATGLPSTATGTVTFTATDPDGTTTTLCSVAATGAADPGCTTPSDLAIGSHVVTASYEGDQTNAASDSTDSTTIVVTTVSTTPKVTVDGGSSATRTYGSTAPLATTGLPADATGTLTYSVDGAAVCTVSVGAACATPSVLATGSHTVTVAYSGDARYAPSSSRTAATLTVTKVASPVTVAASDTTPAHGDAVTFSAGGLPVGATGSVTFRDGTATLCTATVTDRTASCATVTDLATGTHTVTATWTGDANHEPATSAPVTVTVAKATSAIGAGVQGTQTASVEYGTTATFRATSLPADADPTSVVTFLDTHGKTVATATAGDPTYTTPEDQPVGDLVLTAKWDGDADHSGSTSAPISLHVTKATVTISQTVDQGTRSTITHGDTAELAVVGLPKGATGTVEYTGVDGDGHTVTLGEGDASETGASATTSKRLPTGDYTVTAVWSGDDRYSTVTAAAVELIVTQAKPSLTGSVGGSTDPVTTPYGTPTTVEVSEIPDGATGTVEFTVGTGDDAIALCTATLPTTSCTTKADLPAGQYDVTATYSGDHDNAPNTTTDAVSLTVEKAATAITLGTSATAPTYGDPVTLTAGGLPGGVTGTVTFEDGDTVLCTATIENGTASCSPEHALAAGTHEVTAAWKGDSNHASDTSDPVTVTVAKAKATIGATVDGKSTATVEYGTGATIEATGLPAGADGASVVTFTDEHGTVVGKGTAAKPTTTVPADQPVGVLRVTATWAGDGNHDGATADAVTLTVTKARVPLVETVDKTSVTTITHGDSATLEAWGLTKSATGTVTYTAEDANGVRTELGTVDATAEGSPYATSKHLHSGDYSVWATYSGDTQHETVTATAVRLLVAKATPKLTIGTGTPSTPYGTGTTVTIGGLPDDGSGTVIVTARSGDTTVPLCEITLPGSSCATPPALHAGEYELTATYLGDDDHEVDTTDASATLTVTKAATTVAVGDGDGTGTGTGNGTGIGGTYGDPVTLPVSGLPAGATGTVTFEDEDGDPVCTVTLPATSCTTPSDLPVGSHPVTPVYSGDDDHAGSTGDPVTVGIVRAATALTVTAGPSHAWGSSTLLTIGGLPARATGSVVLSVGSTEICTIALPATSCTTDVIEPGTVTVTADWDGDASYLGSSATTLATVTAIHTVNPTHVESSSRTTGPLVWPSITGAVVYQVTVATDEGLSKGVRTVTVNAPLTTTSLDALTAGTTYWYRVTAVSASGTVLSTHDAVMVTAAAAAANPTPGTPPAAASGTPSATASASAAPVAPAKVLQVGELAFTGPTVAVGMIGFGAVLLLVAGGLLLLARRLRDEQGPIGPLRKG